jgi:hypothetical protein
MNATIATTLSMNSRPFTAGLSSGEKGLTSFGQQVKNLQEESRRFKDQAEQAASMTAAQYKKLAGTMQGVQWNRFVAEMTIAAKTEQALASTTGNLSVAMRQLATQTDAATTSRRRFSQTSNLGVGRGGGGGNGMLELSRGLEDFAISASVGGIGMGIRGATNNINAYLSRLGTIGAVASIAVTAGATLISYFERQGKAIEKSNQALERGQSLFASYRDEAQAMVARQQQRQDFQKFVGGIGTTGDAMKEMEQRKQQLKELEQQRLTLWREGRERWAERNRFDNSQADPMEFAKADAAHAAIQVEISENLKQQKRLKEEIAAIDKRYNEQNAKDRLAAIERDRLATVERKAKEQEIQRMIAEGVAQRKRDDANQAMGLVDQIGKQLAPAGFGKFQQFMQLADQRAQVQGMAIPGELKFQLTNLLTEAGLKESAGFRGFAAGVEKGTAAGARMVAEARVRAKEEAEQKKQTAKLTELVGLIRDFIRQLPDPPEGVVNLN